MEGSSIANHRRWSDVPTTVQDPFDTVVGRELIARLEAHLPPEQVPYLDAFIAGEKPQDVAQRLGNLRPRPLQHGCGGSRRSLRTCTQPYARIQEIAPIENEA